MRTESSVCVAVSSISSRRGTTSRSEPSSPPTVSSRCGGSTRQHSGRPGRSTVPRSCRCASCSGRNRTPAHRGSMPTARPGCSTTSCAGRDTGSICRRRTSRGRRSRNSWRSRLLGSLRRRSVATRRCHSTSCSSSGRRLTRVWVQPHAWSSCGRTRTVRRECGTCPVSPWWSSMAGWRTGWPRLPEPASAARPRCWSPVPRAAPSGSSTCWGSTTSRRSRSTRPARPMGRRCSSRPGS